MMASTRRAAVAAILSAPLASAPATATPQGSDIERQFLALSPRLIALVEGYDPARLLWAEPYQIWWSAIESRGRFRQEDEERPEWFAYMAAREPADSIESTFKGLYEPFEDIRFVSFRAILIRFRLARTFEWLEDEAHDDLMALCEAKAFA